MSITTAPAPKAARKPLLLSCLNCGEQGTISIYPESLGQEGEVAFACRSCEAEYTEADVRDIIGEWQRLLAWCDLCPEGE